MMFSSTHLLHIALSTKQAGTNMKLIDHILSNSSSAMQSVVFHAGISDHKITFAFIPCCMERKVINEKFRAPSENHLFFI